MPASCCAVGCTNRGTTHPDLVFYRIPSSKHPFHQNRRKLWLQAIRRADWTEREIKNSRICSAHFFSGKASIDPSSPDFVPSIFTYNRVLTEKNSEQKRNRYERCLKRRKMDSNVNSSLEKSKRGQDGRMDEEINQEPSERSHCVDENITNQDPVPRVQFDELSDKYYEMEKDYRCLIQEVHVLREENKNLKERMGLGKFGYEVIKKNDTLFTFYTGLQTVLIFEWIVSQVRSKLIKHGAVSVEDHILMVIMKLRLDLLTQDIAQRFALPYSVASKIFRTTLPCLSKALKSCIIWPSKEALRKNMPKSFRKKYRNCRCIIDCSEVFIERPTNLTSRAQTWSNYKHHNTIKYLIGITPAGAISFLSPGWGGRVSDKEITLKSGFLDKVEYGDMIMADRGFLIADELAVHGATLQMPYFTKGKKQLAGKEVDTSRQLANVRIHVERVIGRMKNYRILQSVVPITITDLMDSIVTLCACLTNLSRSVVNK